jgi:hypothetical protein
MLHLNRDCIKPFHRGQAGAALLPQCSFYGRPATLALYGRPIWMSIQCILGANAEYGKIDAEMVEMA